MCALKYQFDSGSLAEVNDWIHVRLRDFRALKELRKDKEFQEKYPDAYRMLFGRKFTYTLEIRRLLGIRRAMRKHGIKNWDTDRYAHLVYPSTIAREDSILAALARDIPEIKHNFDIDSEEWRVLSNYEKEIDALLNRIEMSES